MSGQSDIALGAASFDNTAPRAGALSRSTVRVAMGLLQRKHNIADQDLAFAVLRKTSQRHNVKLRAVAAALVWSDVSGTADAKDVHHRRHAAVALDPPSRPALSFSPRAQARHPNVTEVLRDLLQAAMMQTGADRGTVQLREPFYGGLTIEGDSGFDRSCLDFSVISMTPAPRVASRWAKAGR